MLGELIGIVVTVILLEWVLTWIQFKRNGLPCRMGVPFFHNSMHTLRNLDTLFDEQVADMEEQGERGPWLLAPKRGIFQDPMIISGNVHVNKYILSDNFSNWEKGSKFKAWLNPLLGEGIFNADGALWLNQRKMASHMFSKRDLIYSVGIFKSHFEAVEAAMHDGQPIEMQELFSRYTLDCFCAHALGIELDSLSDPNSPFSHAFNTAVKSSLQRALLWPFSKFFPFLFPSEKALADSVATLDSIIFGIIENRRCEKDLEERSDLLSRYVLLQAKQRQEGLTEELEITDRYIRDIILNFCLAGRDTTAHVLCRSLYSGAPSSRSFNPEWGHFF